MKLFEVQEQKWRYFFNLAIHTGENRVVPLENNGSFGKEVPVYLFLFQMEEVRIIVLMQYHEWPFKGRRRRAAACCV